jgi:hypothetical protein
MKKYTLTLLTIITSITLSAQFVTPTQNGDIYSLEVGNVIFEVDASFGARISSFKINGDDILWPAQNGSDFLWGSTLWPSPQSWPWPPPFTALNIEAYNGEIADNKIILTSEKDDFNDLVFEKTFYAETADSSITIEYKMINEGSSTFGAAAWEVTRVPSAGLTYFPRGEGSITGAFAGQFTTIDGVAWYEQSNSDPSGQKMFSDGSDGWFAHITENDYLFLKTFEDVPHDLAASGEAEIELWQAGTYIELENQSSFSNIAAGSSKSYKLKWYLKVVPDDIDISEGSASLVNYTENIAGVTPANEVRALTSKKNFSVYPNPASEYIIIDGNDFENFSISIFDISAKLVLKEEKIISNQRIDVSRLQKGLYIYKLDGSKTRREGKLIIK